jgi:imidazolonepropionase-like amidohydrolase
MKWLIGRTDVEDALKKLGKLTDEETRMAIAQNLMATHNVDERVKGVATTVVETANDVDQIKRSSSLNLIDAGC